MAIRGEKLVVCMDANKNIYSKLIGQALTDQEGLGLSKVVFFCHQPLSVLFFVWIKGCGKFHMSTQLYKKCKILC